MLGREHCPHDSGLSRSSRCWPLRCPEGVPRSTGQYAPASDDESSSPPAVTVRAQNDEPAPAVVPPAPIRTQPPIRRPSLPGRGTVADASRRRRYVCLDLGYAQS